MNTIQQRIIQQLRRESNAGEETEHLLDWLEDAWETLEILQERFGESIAIQIYTASPSYLPIEEQSVISMPLEAAHPIVLRAIEELEENYYHVS